MNVCERKREMHTTDVRLMFFQRTMVENVYTLVCDRTKGRGGVTKGINIPGTVSGCLLFEGIELPFACMY